MGPQGNADTFMRFMLEELPQKLGQLEQLLSATTFIFGESITLADFVVADCFLQKMAWN